MPTIIDSLIIEIGLDPKKLTAGQKAAVESFKKSQNEMLRGAKAQEDAQKKAADAFSTTTRRALEFFAVLLGARGLKEFVTDITSANAALGRFATNIGESPQVLAAWENAAQRMGGSAEQTAGSFNKLAQSLYNLTHNGEMLPKEFSQLSAAAGMNIDPYHGLDKFLNDVAAALKKVHDANPTQANFLAQGLGIDASTAQIMYKYGAGSSAYVNSLKGLSPSNADIQAAQDLQASWFKLQQTVISMAQDALPKLEKELSPIINEMANWVEKNKDWIDTGFAKAVGDFATWLKGIDWKAVGAGMQSFASGAKSLADALGGVQTATEVIFGLWLGAQFLSVLANVAKLGAAIAAVTGGTASAVGGVGGVVTGAVSAGASTAAGAAATVGGLALAAWLASTGTAGSGEGDKVRALNGGFNKGAQNWMNPYLQSVTVNGSPVSKANPLPVTTVDQTSGSNWLSNVGSAVGGFFSNIGNAISGGAHAPSSGGSVGSAGTHGWWTPDRQAHAYQRLTTEGGLSDAGARGLISRWMNVESPGGPSSVNPSSGAFGIGQWLGSRKAGIAGNTNFDAQLSHAISELKGSEGNAASLLRNAKTNLQGATGASMYERAEGYDPLSGTDNFTNRTAAGMGGIVTNAGALKWAFQYGAKAAAAGGKQSSIQTNHTVHVGELHVHSKAADAPGIAKDIMTSLRRSTTATLANTGLA